MKTSLRNLSSPGVARRLNPTNLESTFGAGQKIDRETDPDVLKHHLFELTDPGFVSRCKPGDIIVAGRNFGVGGKRVLATLP